MTADGPTLQSTGSKCNNSVLLTDLHASSSFLPRPEATAPYGPQSLMVELDVHSISRDVEWKRYSAVSFSHPVINTHHQRYQCASKKYFRLRPSDLKSRFASDSALLTIVHIYKVYYLLKNYKLYLLQWKGTRWKQQMILDAVFLGLWIINLTQIMCSVWRAPFTCYGLNQLCYNSFCSYVLLSVHINHESRCAHQLD